MNPGDSLSGVSYIVLEVFSQFHPKDLRQDNIYNDSLLLFCFLPYNTVKSRIHTVYLAFRLIKPRTLYAIFVRVPSSIAVRCFVFWTQRHHNVSTITRLVVYHYRIIAVAIHRHQAFVPKRLQYVR